MNELLIKQMMADYNVTREEVLDNKNHFTIYKINDDIRKYNHIEECEFRCIAINNKIIATGSEKIIEVIKEKFKDFDGRWIYEIGPVRRIDKILEGFGLKISMLHPYYISEEKSVINKTAYEIKRFNHEEIFQFKDDERIDEAFGYHERTPDVVAYGAYIDNKLVGIAGASIDSTYMAQIGINIFEGYDGKGIASMLVALTKNDILDMGYLPYYGTSVSHQASQRVAFNAGFKPAWVELFSMPINVED